MRQASGRGAHIVKIATLAKTAHDVQRLLQVTLAQRGQPLVTIAMGRVGSVSRLAFPLAGSLLTYTSLRPAHGQIPLTRLIADLQFYYPKQARV